MAQVLRPENIGAISKVSNTILSIGASLAIIGGQQRQTSTINITTSTLGMNGIDTGAIAINQFYYVYLVINNGVTGGVISLSASAPTGFPAYKLVGQCTTDGSAFLVAANKSDVDNAPIGHIMSAMLTEQQFRAVHGAGWVLASGQSVAGSKYTIMTGVSTAPDLRGMFLRGRNNGRIDGLQNPDGEIALGGTANDAIRNITGTINGFNPNVGGSGAMSASPSVGADTNQWGANAAQTITFNAGVVVPTAADNRPKNITVNHFIKIN